MEQNLKKFVVSQLMRSGSQGNRVCGLYYITLDHLEYQILVLVMLEHHILLNTSNSVSLSFA